MTNRELDAAIAEALGWTGIGVTHEHEVAGDTEDYDLLVGIGPDGMECVPCYSTDPVAAVALMRALRERGLCIVLDIDERPAATVMWEGCADCDVFEAAGDTWTLALAKAALSALTVAGKP